MKIAQILIFLCLYYAACTKDQPKNPLLPKLSIYAGLGFNLLQANPLSNSADAGFKKPIFKSSYSKNRTTKDNHYLISDSTLSKAASLCSFSPTVSIHRGTQSYKNALQKIVEYKGLKLTGFSASAFSLSSQFDKMEVLTIKQRKTVIHASAQCQGYRISLDTIRKELFEDAFISSIKTSFQKKDWADFIEFYGTHYVTEVVMGGRVLQEIVFSSESISNLKYLGVDLQKTAKARFEMISGDKLQNWRKHQNEIKYLQSLVNDKSEVLLGGKPPKDGNTSVWSKQVAEKPLPIGYKLTEITDLFQKIQEVQIQLKLHEVKESYVKSLTQYCKKMGCRLPISDLPAPEPVKLKLYKGTAVGKPEGEKFLYTLKSPTAKLVKVSCYAANSIIDRIQLLFDDKVKKTYSPFIGSLGRGTLVEWTVPQNQYITQVEATFDKISLSGFGFITNLGTKSTYCGKESGTYTLVNIPDGYRIVGVYGSKSHFISSLGFILAKNEYPQIANSKQNQKPAELQKGSKPS